MKVFEVITPGVNTNLQNDWAIKPNPGMMMDADKMVGIVIEGLLKDKPELRPTMIGVIQLAARMVPNLLIKFGHREIKRFKQAAKQ